MPTGKFSWCRCKGPKDCPGTLNKKGCVKQDGRVLKCKLKVTVNPVTRLGSALNDRFLQRKDQT